MCLQKYNWTSVVPNSLVSNAVSEMESYICPLLITIKRTKVNSF